MFTYQAGELHCEQVALDGLAAEHGTPLYVYSAAAVRASVRALAQAFAPLRPQICFAVKANANLELLRLLRAEAVGFDIVSGGELYCALQAGADPAHIVFAGVGKTDAELEQALQVGVGWFNAESADELRRLNALAAARGQRARVALRLNPGVEADTHHHIQTGGHGNKFGLPAAEALQVVERAADFPALDLRGLHLHIGSQIPSPSFTLQAVEVALDFRRQANERLRALGRPPLDTLDIGGGFPVAYRASDAYPPIADFAAPLVARLRPLTGELSFHVEPGRFLVADAGVLLTQVVAVKLVDGRRTLVVDAGMNDLIRPALYDAYHEVQPLRRVAELGAGAGEALTDVVGPICESSDVLARGRSLPRLEVGERLALRHAGAYGYSMASNYNAQPRPAEVLVEGERARLIRRRETYADLVRLQAA